MIRISDGRKLCIIDNKGRFCTPARWIPEFKECTWAIDRSSRRVVLYPKANWETFSRKVPNLQNWQPEAEKQKSAGRIHVPDYILRRLGLSSSAGAKSRVTVVSAGDHLELSRKTQRKRLLLEKRTGAIPELTPFCSGEEAEEYRRSGKKVVYFSSGNRQVVGMISASAGGLFTFRGKDGNGIIVSVFEPYWKFYPLERG